MGEKQVRIVLANVRGVVVGKQETGLAEIVARAALPQGTCPPSRLLGSAQKDRFYK